MSGCLPLTRLHQQFRAGTTIQLTSDAALVLLYSDIRSETSVRSPKVSYKTILHILKWFLIGLRYAHHPVIARPPFRQMADAVGLRFVSRSSTRDSRESGLSFNYAERITFLCAREPILTI